jgi:hypothetical protein
LSIISLMKGHYLLMFSIQEKDEIVTMKKTVTSIALLFFAITLFAQADYDSLVFDNNVVLKNGIYTSCYEIRTNSPQYTDCELEMENIRKKIHIDYLFFINSNNTRLKFESNLFAIVSNGRIYLFCINQLNPVFLKAAISTFMVKDVVYSPTSNYGSNYDNYKIKTTMYFLDYETGVIDKITKENLTPIITRDTKIKR